MMRRYYLLLLLLVSLQSQAAEPLCLWISSYHQGYEWEDGIERGLRAGLGERCRLEVFRLDTKRHPDSAFGVEQGARANQLIASLRPDIVILSDDNASRYVALPYLRDSTIPLLFCGINWDVKGYGYPWPNATGMVETAPVVPLLKEIRQVVEKPARGLYLSANVYTEQVDAGYYVKSFARQEIVVETLLVNTMQEWIEGYKKGQQYDFIVLGNYAGIGDWDGEVARSVAQEFAGRITVTNYDWMMPYAMVGKSKVPEEHGEWMAQLVGEVLGGTSAGDIPVVSNRRWSAYINPALMQKAGITLNRNSIHNAIKVE